MTRIFGNVRTFALIIFTISSFKNHLIADPISKAQEDYQKYGTEFLNAIQTHDKEKLAHLLDVDKVSVTPEFTKEFYKHYQMKFTIGQNFQIGGPYYEALFSGLRKKPYAVDSAWSALSVRGIEGNLTRRDLISDENYDFLCFLLDKNILPYTMYPVTLLDRDGKKVETPELDLDLVRPLFLMAIGREDSKSAAKLAKIAISAVKRRYYSDEHPTRDWMGKLGDDIAFGVVGDTSTQKSRASVYKNALKEMIKIGWQPDFQTASTSQGLESIYIRLIESEDPVFRDTMLSNLNLLSAVKVSALKSKSDEKTQKALEEKRARNIEILKSLAAIAVIDDRPVALEKFLKLGLTASDIIDALNDKRSIAKRLFYDDKFIYNGEHYDSFNLKRTKIIIENDPSVLQTDLAKETFLDLIRNHNLEAVEYFLKNGFKPSWSDSLFSNLFIAADQAGGSEVFSSKFKSSDADKFEFDREKSEAVKIAKLLVEHGLSLTQWVNLVGNGYNKVKVDPITKQVSMWGSDLYFDTSNPVTQYLFESSLKTLTAEELNGLLVAVLNQAKPDYERAEELLKKSVSPNPNFKTDDGVRELPICIALDFQNFEFAEKLISAGADLNRPCALIAADEDTTVLAHYLASPNNRSYRNKTSEMPKDYFLRNHDRAQSDLNVVKFFLKHSIELKAQKSDSKEKIKENHSELMKEALVQGDLELVKMLDKIGLWDEASLDPSENSIKVSYLRDDISRMSKEEEDLRKRYNSKDEDIDSLVNLQKRYKNSIAGYEYLSQPREKRMEILAAEEAAEAKKGDSSKVQSLNTKPRSDQLKLLNQMMMGVMRPQRSAPVCLVK